MGVGDGVSFRATSFMGGGNSSRSFTERLDRKERMKKLDEQHAEREAENLRRYEISQSRLQRQDVLTATELSRQHGRQDIVDANNKIIFNNSQTDRKTKIARDVIENNRDDVIHDVKMYNYGNQIIDDQKARERLVVTQGRADDEHKHKVDRREITEGHADTNQANAAETYQYNKAQRPIDDAREKDIYDRDKKKADAAALIQASKDKQYNKNMQGVNDIPQILMDTNTEMADALNMKYKHVNDAPTTTPKEVADKKLALDELNRTAQNLYNDGKLDLNRVTNAKQYNDRMTKELYERGVDPVQAKTIVDSYTANALDESKTADATTAQMLKDEKARYDIEIKANDKKEQQGNLADSAAIVTATKEGLDNTVQDAYKGLSTDKNGKIRVKGAENDDDNDRVGNQELDGFVTDLLLADFEVATKKTKDGTTTKQTRRPTKSEIISAIKKASYNNNMVRADHVDASETLEYLEAIMKKNGMNPSHMKKKDNVLADINQKRKNKIAKDNKNPTGEQRLNEKFKIERALAEERLRAKNKKP